jgi:hypothetical protein
MATEVYKTTQDTSIPRAVALIGEDEILGKIYQTEGRSYNAGDYVLASDISPPFLDAIERGELDSVLEPADMDDYEAWAYQGTGMIWAPEHGVEAEAMARAGHKIVPRDVVLELRSLGAQDAADRIEAAKADGADERPNLSMENTPNLADPDDDSAPRIKGADIVDDPAVAVAAGVQVTPSGLMATNPNKTAEELASETESRSRPSRSRTRPKPKPADDAPQS